MFNTKIKLLILGKYVCARVCVSHLITSFHDALNGNTFAKEKLPIVRFRNNGDLNSITIKQKQKQRQGGGKAKAHNSLRGAKR